MKSRQSWSLFWSKKHSHYKDVKLKVFKKEDNRDFCQVQKLITADPNLNQFQRLRIQLVVVAGRDQKLPPVVQNATLSNDIEEPQKACSQCGQGCGPTKEKNLCDSTAIQCGQNRDLQTSSPIICQKKQRATVLTIFLCKLLGRRLFIIARCFEFCISRMFY